MDPSPSSRLTHCECLVRDGQSHRAAHKLKAWDLHRSGESARGCYLAATALMAAGEAEEALAVMDACVDLVDAARKEAEAETEPTEKLRMKQVRKFAFESISQNSYPFFIYRAWLQSTC